MSTYLHELSGGNPSLTEIFHGLYRTSDGLVKELKDLIAEEYGEDSGMPRTSKSHLELGWSAGRDTDTGGWSHTTRIMARSGFDASAILSISRHQIKANDEPLPETVGAFRGNELGPDYRVHEHITGFVECKLGAMGLIGATKGEEPFGRTGFIGRTRLQDLDMEHQERVAVVTHGILNGITAVEMIRDGDDPIEVFDALGRSLARR